MLNTTVEYVKEREQFGKPVGSYQAVKHHLAEVAKAVSFARPSVYAAAWAVAQSAVKESAVSQSAVSENSVKQSTPSRRAISETDRPNLGLQIDAWHHFRGPIPASAALAEASQTASSQASGSETSQGRSPESGRIEENDNPAKSSDVASRPNAATPEAMAESCGVFFSFPGQRIFAIQVCDAGPPQGRPFEDTMKRRLFPGEGEFPLAALIATLRLIGCQAPVSVEVFSDPLSPDQQETRARQAAETARSLIDESAVTLKTIMEQFS